MLLTACWQHVEQEPSRVESTRTRVVPGGADRSLAEQVEKALRATGYPGLRSITVSVHGRLAFLRGRVPSYYMKQKAQVVAMTVTGVTELCNEVEVIRSHPLSRTSRAGFSVVSSRVEESHES